MIPSSTGASPRLTHSFLPVNHNHALPGPEDIFRCELENGIIVLARSNFNSPSVVLTGYLQVGSLLDTDQKLGLADFTATALMRGTEKHSFQQIYDALETVGAGLGFSSGAHNTSFSGRSLVEDLDLLLELLGETLRTPTFPNDYIERLRTQLLTGLAIRSQDTSEMAAMAFDQILFKDHPYRRPDDGYPETIAAIEREDIVSFHRNNYGPRGMVIVIVGAIDPKCACDKVAKILGDWRNPSQSDIPALPNLQPLTGTMRQNVTIPGKSQSDIILGCGGPERNSLDFMPASLGNNILGQFGMYGRIGESVREKAGLAYYAFSSLNCGVGPGAWFAAAGVEPANIEKTISLISREIERLVKEPVGEAELNDSKANFIGRLPLSLESNSGIAGSLATLERYQLGLDYYLRYPGAVQAVTIEQILETAHKYLHPERMAIATAGP